MKTSDTMKVAAVTFAVGMMAGVAGEMYMQSTGKMKSTKKKAGKAIKALGTIIDEVKDVID